MKKALAVLLTSVMLMATACTYEPIEINTPTSDTTVAETTAETTISEETEVENEINYEVTYPVTLKDQVGREVVIESEPERIVSGYYISSSMLIALGLDDKMVGIESNPEKRPIYALSAPDLLDLTTVGSMKEFDFEACVSVDPDLVILPFKLKDAADQLEKLGIDVLVVQPENEELLVEMAELVATATNTIEREIELVNYITDVKDLLDEALSDVDASTIYLSGNSDFLSTASNGMYQSDMIALAGGSNVADEIEDDYWVMVSYEQILSWNPEYIILASNAAYSVDDVLDDKNLAICDAITNENVYKIPSDAEAWDSPVPGSVLGSLWLASVLYPDIISADTCYDVIDDYYETFYGFKYSEIASE